MCGSLHVSYRYLEALPLGKIGTLPNELIGKLKAVRTYVDWPVGLVVRDPDC